MLAMTQNNAGRRNVSGRKGHGSGKTSRSLVWAPIETDIEPFETDTERLGARTRSEAVRHR